MSAARDLVPARLTPVFLLGMPRSGTTWLSQIIESSPACAVRLSPNFSYPLKHQLSEGSPAAQWERVLREALESDDPFMTQNYRRDTGELGVFPAKNTADLRALAIKDTRYHDIYLAGMERIPAAKAVYIVRHPAAALWSWRSCKEFPEDADFESEWRTGRCRKAEPGEYWGFEDWLGLTREYCARAAREPERYHVLRYEDMVASAEPTTAALFEFLGLPLSDQTRAFLTESQSRHDPRPYAVYKSKSVVDAYRARFPAELLAQIEAETRTEPFARFVR